MPHRRQRRAYPVVTHSYPINVAAVPLALYVHIPWCEKRCGYCDFNAYGTGGANDALPIDRYITALCQDFSTAYAQAQTHSETIRPLISIFFGGGTPSLFPPEAIGKFLQHVYAHAPVCDTAEITLEANPGTVSTDTLAHYKAAGINRLSFGAQSFSNRVLRALGRIHTEDAIGDAVLGAKTAGFSAVSVDLMYGLPEQTQTVAADDIHTALQLPITHISYYELTLEPNTPFGKRPPIRGAENTRIAMQTRSIEAITTQGLSRYEISNFGAPCLHNCNYWLFGDYIGIGAGAHGKYSTSQGIIRTTRPNSPRRYFAAIDTQEPMYAEQIKGTSLISEFFLGALRLTGGFSSELLTARTGYPIQAINSILDTAVTDDLLTKTSTQIQPTDKGHRFLDTLTERFF